ncbi:MAG TPA: zf-HC2 domain-containing protein [Thermoanaerobaculia bacterium]|nr:zf-HC2 domain-containing protein [Thermoanaerobaculia bacterium]
MNAHYDETALQDYLDDPMHHPDRDAIEAHVAYCKPCAATLEELRAFDATLAAEVAWETERESAAETPGVIREFADLLATEDATAREMLAPLLASPVSFRRANVTARPVMRTAGVVRLLCTESRELRERQPMHALVLADSAIAIADQLPSDLYPAPLLDDLRGSAWLERANVLRYLGRYAEALDAIDIAQRAFARSPVAAFSGALADYLRGVVFVETERLEDAMRLVRKAARVFRQFGEHERYVHAKIVEATVLFDQRRVRDARDLFVSLIATAKELGHAQTLARLYANVANCQLRLHELASADDYYSRALSLFEALGLETERIRTRWNIGCLRIVTGDLADGLSRLREAAREFSELGLRTDAALVTLDLAEALLAAGDPPSRREAAELCTSLVESFTAVGMTGHALTALAYLREAFESGQATPDLVRHVRHYLETHPDQSGIPFIPPPHL